MPTYDEIIANSVHFLDSIPNESRAASDSLRSSPRYTRAYVLLTSLQAWRVFVIEPQYLTGLDFFIEAQNDCLSSLALSCIGARRSALQNLRSAIENISAFHYFSEHPIEYQLWESGRFRTSFSKFADYMKEHPLLSQYSSNNANIDVFINEYATLSRAVHGYRLFRMSQSEGDLLLFDPDPIQSSMWFTRFRNVIRAENELLLSYYSSHLEGAAYLPLREILFHCFEESKKQRLTAAFNVVFPK